MGGRRDDNPVQSKSVFSVNGLGLICDSRTMQGRVQEVSASVTGKHPTRAICAMGGGSEAEDKSLGPRIAKDRYGATPVFLIREALSLFPRHLFAPLN